MSRGSPCLSPSQRRRLIRMFRVRLKLVVVGRASWGIVWPVMLTNILLLAPLILLRVGASRHQASHPYVSSEHTAVLYKRIFRCMEREGDLNMCLRSPQRCSAIATRALTSLAWFPSAAKREPRYLNTYTLWGWKKIYFLPCYLKIQEVNLKRKEGCFTLPSQEQRWKQLYLLPSTDLDGEI